MNLKSRLLLKLLRLCPGAGNPNKGTNPRDEPKLHRIQVPADQSSSVDQGELTLMSSHMEDDLNHLFRKATEFTPLYKNKEESSRVGHTVFKCLG